MDKLFKYSKLAGFAIILSAILSIALSFAPYAVINHEVTLVHYILWLDGPLLNLLNCFIMLAWFCLLCTLVVKRSPLKTPSYIGIAAGVMRTIAIILSISWVIIRLNKIDYDLSQLPLSLSRYSFIFATIASILSALAFIFMIKFLPRGLTKTILLIYIISSIYYLIASPLIEYYLHESFLSKRDDGGYEFYEFIQNIRYGVEKIITNGSLAAFLLSFSNLNKQKSN